MIIGEGPGANEDAEGKPFVGRAGKLLDKMLAAIQLNRTKVYISNVVNYRPPNNRKPTDDEIARYLPFLVSHIEIINPKIILLLGSTALNALIGNEIVITVKANDTFSKIISPYFQNKIDFLQKDSLLLSVDTLINKVDSIIEKKSDVETTVNYTSKDSIFFDLKK